MNKKTTIKDGLTFWKEMKARRKMFTIGLRPRVYYTKEYNIFSMNWGQKKVYSTIELNLLGGGDLRFDVTKNGTIVGIEIEGFDNVLKKFNCDKNERRRKK